ncbi:MAG: rhodanese-like domain-containing protein, partial [Acidimicrobiales bacterium]
MITVPTFREMLSDAKAAIREIHPAQAEEAMRSGTAVVLDVREPDEYEQGALPGAVHIPRGTLETSVEGRIPDKSSYLVVYCAG